nr:hypothetical protein [Pandoravirus belohorizontensis]
MAARPPPRTRGDCRGAPPQPVARWRALYIHRPSVIPPHVLFRTRGSKKPFFSCMCRLPSLPTNNNRRNNDDQKTGEKRKTNKSKENTQRGMPHEKKTKKHKAQRPKTIFLACRSALSMRRSLVSEWSRVSFSFVFFPI